ncbi:hypothetical protein ACLVWQ_17560 (plasmid) [Streptomyces sp. CWNU-52B]|uniref:hypothetical protein n=1 Tax=unclassified Streptomyces TaxID=2593676 RepID=UPI0039C0ABA7
MRVRMKVTISGTRNGEPWPERGEIKDLPDGEAKYMIGVGLAEELADEDGGEAAEENAADPGEPEKAAGRRKPMTKSSLDGK